MEELNLNKEQLGNVKKGVDKIINNFMVQVNHKNKEVGYSEKQLSEIMKGVEEGIDVRKYANIDFTHQQMKEIRLRLVDLKNELSKYEKLGFNEFQLEEIREGLEERLDVSLYAKRDLNNEKMKEIRYKLRALKKAKENNIDMSEYVEAGFNGFQLEEIMKILTFYKWNR